MMISIPFQFEPRPYQLEFLTALQRFKVGVWNRKSGKSKTALNYQISKTQLNKGIYYYFLPTYRMAKAAVWDDLVKQHVPSEIVSRFNESDLAIYYKNGSIQRFVGCEDINKHRGINPIDVVLDEYSEMDEKIWTEILLPVLRQNNGTATFIFTPKGTNHSWRRLQYAKSHPEEYFYSVLDVYQTKSHSPEEIESAKREMPRVLFDQELMVKFLEGAGQFFKNFQRQVWDGQMNPVREHYYQLGVDLAKFQDWTVITPLDLMTFQVGWQDRFNQIDFTLQEAKIEALYHKFNKAKTIIDSTGLGEPIFDHLVARGMQNLEPFHFTEPSRRDLLVNLQMLLEQNKIKLPNDPDLFSELEGFKYELTEKGRIRIVQSEGMTDDRVMSLALACWGLSPNPLPTPRIYQKEILKQFDYYQDKRFRLR